MCAHARGHAIMNNHANPGSGLAGVTDQAVTAVACANSRRYARSVASRHSSAEARRSGRSGAPGIAAPAALAGSLGPAGPVAALAASLVGVAYGLTPQGRLRRVVFAAAGALVLALALAEMRLGRASPSGAVAAVIIGMGIPLLAFRLVAPEASFPVSYQRGSARGWTSRAHGETRSSRRSTTSWE